MENHNVDKSVWNVLFGTGLFFWDLTDCDLPPHSPNWFSAELVFVINFPMLLWPLRFPMFVACRYSHANYSSELI